MCNKRMRGVALIDHKAAAYHLDQTQLLYFFLRLIFNLMDVAFAKSCIIYNMMHANDLKVLDLRTIVSTYLFRKQNWKFLMFEQRNKLF